MNIYVGNLPKTVTEDAVRALFEEHGEVTAVKLIKDQETGGLRGFGFIEMPSRTQAQTAIKELNETEFEGRNLVVNEARSRSDKSGGRHRGGGGPGGFRGGNRGSGNSRGQGRSRSW